MSRPATGAAAPHTALALLLAGIALAWLFVVYGPSGMHAGLLAFLVPWTVMMAAMMLPSAAPLVLLYRRGASAANTAVLAAGYLIVWGVAGVPAYFAHMLLPMSAGPVALAIAGVYQFTPLKRACLESCRGPADFVVRRWGRSALRLGIEHGAWCAGCCWALMGILVIVGAMGLAWVLGLTALVALEKLTRRGELWARLIGVALLIAAVSLGAGSWNGTSMEMS